MRKSVLRAYARLIARSGVNIQKGQEVFIAAVYLRGGLAVDHGTVQDVKGEYLFRGKCML